MKAVSRASGNGAIFEDSRIRVRGWNAILTGPRWQRPHGDRANFGGGR